MISIKSSPIKRKISGKSIVVSAVVFTNVNQVNELVLEDKNKTFFLVVETKEKYQENFILFCFFLRKVIYLDCFSSLEQRKKTEGLTSESGSFDLGREFCIFDDEWVEAEAESEGRFATRILSQT